MLDQRARERVRLGQTHVGWGLTFVAEHGGNHALLEVSRAGASLLLFPGLPEGLEESYVSLIVDAEAGPASGAMFLRDSRQGKPIMVGFRQSDGEPHICLR